MPVSLKTNVNQIAKINQIKETEKKVDDKSNSSNLIKTKVAVGSGLAALTAIGIYIATRGKSKPIKPTEESQKLVEQVKNKLNEKTTLSPEILDSYVEKSNGKIKSSNEVWSLDDMKKYYEELDVPHLKSDILDKQNAKMTIKNGILYSKDNKPYTGEVVLSSGRRGSTDDILEYTDGKVSRLKSLNSRNEVCNEKIYENGKLSEVRDYSTLGEEGVTLRRVTKYKHNEDGSIEKKAYIHDEFAKKLVPQESVKIIKKDDGIHKIINDATEIVYSKNGRKEISTIDNEIPKISEYNRKGQLIDCYQIVDGKKIDKRPKIISATIPNSNFECSSLENYAFNEKAHLAEFVGEKRLLVEPKGDEKFGIVWQNGKNLALVNKGDDLFSSQRVAFAKNNEGKYSINDKWGNHLNICENEKGIYISTNGYRSAIYDPVSNSFKAENKCGLEKDEPITDFVRKIFANGKYKTIEEAFNGWSGIVQKAEETMNNSTISKKESILALNK